MVYFIFLLTVTAPVVEVTTSSSDILYQATQQSLICEVAFIYTLPVDVVTVQFEWNFQGTVVQNDTRITVNNPYISLDPFSNVTSSKLTFSPINTTDSGNYTCTVCVSVNGSPTIIISPQIQQRSINIDVTGTSSFKM